MSSVKRNQHGLVFKRPLVGAEQEFNTHTYGIKGNIDGLITVQDREGKQLLTALEIKAGKNHSLEYKG